MRTIIVSFALVFALGCGKKPPCKDVAFLVETTPRECPEVGQTLYVERNGAAFCRCP